MAITKIQAGALPAGVVTVDAIADTSITHAKLHTDMDLSAKTVVLPTLSTLDVSGNVTVAGTVDGVDIQTLNTAVIANTAKVTNYNQTKADIEALGIAASSITGALPAISGAALTDVAKLSVGTSAPSTPAVGDQWFDTTSGVTAMKVWSGTLWNQMSNKFSATGGTESTYSSGGIFYNVHTFTSSGTFTAEASGAVDVLVVAGGGAGGGGYGGGAGGGGAGGYQVSPALSVSSGSYTVIVGGGGAPVDGNVAGTSGSNSVFSTITSIGGGGGVSQATATAGGSGGGGGETAAFLTGGAGTAGQGNNGGTGNDSGGNSGAGGGGAGSVGGNSSPSVVGAGGVGLQNNYRTGSNIYYGGGGGASGNNLPGSSGGLGGGGNGGPGSGGSGTVTGGATNTGGGGGGTFQSGKGLYGGGSGIVIIRYAV